MSQTNLNCIELEYELWFWSHCYHDSAKLLKLPNVIGKLLTAAICVLTCASRLKKFPDGARPHFLHFVTCLTSKNLSRRDHYMLKSAITSENVSQSFINGFQPGLMSWHLCDVILPDMTSYGGWIILTIHDPSRVGPSSHLSKCHNPLLKRILLATFRRKWTV